MTRLKEYDIEFKPSHVMKGHGLCQTIVQEKNASKDGSSRWEQEIEMHNIVQATPTDTPTS